ncbi:unnamed protein product, partial [Closterium sp. NIES-54]
FTPGGQRVTHYTCSRTGRHLATFTRRPRSSLYTLTTASPPVTASGQVGASGQVFSTASRFSPAFAPCSGRPLSHETLLWHHRLGHPSLPRLRGMASRTLVSGLPMSLPPLPPGPAPTCVPCVKGRQRTTPHSSDERFGSDLLVLRLHSDRGGEFSSDLLRAFCRAEGIRQTFTLPASPQQNGIAERRIGMVMDVARTSMIHAAAPHFLWSFAVQYAAHHINLQPRVSLPETTPTLRWTGKVGDASVFRVWGSRAFVRDASADKLSSHAGPAPSGVSQVDPVKLVEVAVDSGAARGAEPAGAGPGGAEPGVAESECAKPWGAEPERVEPRGAESGGAGPGGAELERAEPGGAEPRGAEPGSAEPERGESGGLPGVQLRREPPSPQQLREWYARRCRRAAGATGPTAGGALGAGAAGGAAGAAVAGGASGAAGGAAGAGAAGAADPGGAGTVGGPAGVGAAGGAGAAGRGGARTGGTKTAGAGGAAGVGAGGTGAGGAMGVVAGDPGAVSGGAARPRPYYPASPLPGPSPYYGPTRGLTERREPESRPASPGSRPPSLESRPALPESRPALPESRPALPESHPVRTGHRVARHSLYDSASFYCSVACPSAVSSYSTAASTLVAKLVNFASHCRLDCAASFVAESESASVYPTSVGGECALGTDVLEDRQEEFECFSAAVPHRVSMLLAPEGDPDAPHIPTPRSYAEAVEGPYSSQWQTAMDAKMASWKSTGTYVDEVPPPGRTSQRQGVDFFLTFSPTPKMTTLRVLLYVAVQRDYELHSLDFSTAFLQGSLHEEIWLRRPPGFTGSFRVDTQWSLWRPVYGLRQAPREWHNTLRTTLAALGFAPSTADLSLFLRTDATLPLFYVLVYVDDLVFATADTDVIILRKSVCRLSREKIQRRNQRGCTPQ